MDKWEIKEAEDAYKSLKHGTPSAQNLVDAANILKRAVDVATNHDAETYHWDNG